MHFAAKALVGESMRDPELYDRWNRGKTEVLARVAAAEGVRAFVFSSTCAVYGEPEEVPIDEKQERRPVNPYGLSKVACEDALFATGVPTAALRYFNAAGAEPEHGLGERHDPETHLIPLAAATALGRRDVFVVYGDGYDTRDGTCIRDFIHVDDLADAHVLALSRLRGGGGSGAFNLGNGKGFSIREVIDAVREVAGRGVLALVKLYPGRGPPHRRQIRLTLHQLLRQRTGRSELPGGQQPGGDRQRTQQGPFHAAPVS